MHRKVSADALVGTMVALLLLFAVPERVNAQPSPKPAMRITIQVNRKTILEGGNVVVSALAVNAKEDKPASGIYLFAKVNGKKWGAKYRTLVSGVAHLLLPLPELGKSRCASNHLNRPVRVLFAQQSTALPSIGGD